MPSDLATAQTILRGLRREVTEEEDGFVLRLRDQRYVLKKAELEHYLSRKPEILRSHETQLFFPGFYEHVIRFEGAVPRRIPRRTGSLNNTLTSADGLTSIELGRLSTVFCLSLTDVDRIDLELRRFSMPGSNLGREIEARPIADLFRLTSIRVTTPHDNAIGKSQQRLHELAEAAAFHFAFGRGDSISFTKSWERTYYWIGRKETEEVQFPLRTYNSELVGYYNLALASDSLVLGYLALYQIIEYFYTSVSENALHEKVREQLVTPDFVHTKPKKLRELIKTIRQFEAKLDEPSALKLVLGTYFEKAVLRQWIEEYEEKHGSYFTNEVTLFGSSFRLDTSDNTIIPNLALRIYKIRNALVHNKEGEIGRFVPYTGQEEVLNKEVQILLFLAEQLIVKTGKDITW
ncbi:MAG: hypothetical protein M3X11_07460 [Acidobacteriota bacterium]|nr:hypothetical protein [Acidobacteriota bacterium]